MRGVSEAPKRSRGRPRREGTDEEILSVARKLLAERGYRELTVDAVAERAGVAKTTVYRRWPSKGALVGAAIVPPPGRLTGTGADLALDPAQNNSFRAISRAWKEGASVQRLVGDAGARYIVSGLSEASQAELVKTLALVAERTTPVGAAAVAKPRIGLFRPWGQSMDEGWTRWVLEQYRTHRNPAA